MQKNERKKTQANISPLLLSRQWLESSLLPSLTFEANTFSSLFPSSTTTYVRQSNKYTEWIDEGQTYKVTDDGEVLDEDFESDSEFESEEEELEAIIEEEEKETNKIKSPSISTGRKYSIIPPSRERRRSSFSPRLSQINPPTKPFSPGSPSTTSNALNIVESKLKKKLNKCTSSILPNFILSKEKLNSKNFSALDFLKLSPSHIYSPPTLTSGIVPIEDSSSSASASVNAAIAFAKKLPPPPNINSEQIYRSLYIHCSALLELIDEAKQLDQYEKMIQEYQYQQQRWDTKEEKSKSDQFNLPLHTRISECIFRILLYHQEKLHDEYFLPTNFTSQDYKKEEEKINIEKDPQNNPKVNPLENALIMRSNYSSSRKGNRRLSSFSNPSFQVNLTPNADNNIQENTVIEKETISQLYNENISINNTEINSASNSSFLYNNFIANPPPLLNYHHVLFFSHLHDKYYQKQQDYLIEQEKKIKKLEKEVILTKHHLSIARISTSSLNYQNNLLLLTQEEESKKYGKKIKSLETRNKFLEIECEKWRILFQGGHNEVDSRGDIILKPGAKDSSNNSIMMMTKILMMTMNNIMNFLTRSIINLKKKVHEEDMIVKIMTQENVLPNQMSIDLSAPSNPLSFPSLGISETYNVEKHGATDLVLESMSGSMETIMMLSNRLMEIVEDTHHFKQLTDTQNSNISSLKNKLKITNEKKNDIEYENNLLKSKMMKLITYIEQSESIVNKINFSTYNSSFPTTLVNLTDQEVNDFLRESFVIKEDVSIFISLNKEENVNKKEGILCAENEENKKSLSYGDSSNEDGKDVFTTTDTKYIENHENMENENIDVELIIDYYDMLKQLVDQEEDDQLLNLFKGLLETVLNKIRHLENSMNDRICNLKISLKEFLSQLQTKFYIIMKEMKEKLEIVEKNLIISKKNEENLKEFLLTLLKNEEFIPLNTENSLEEIIETEVVHDNSLKNISENEINNDLDLYSSHINRFIKPFEDWSTSVSIKLIDYSVILYSNSLHNFSFSKSKKYNSTNLKEWLAYRHSELLNSFLRINSLNVYSDLLLLAYGNVIREREEIINLNHNLNYNYQLVSYRNIFYKEEVFNKFELIRMNNHQVHFNLKKLTEKHELILNRYLMLVEDFADYEVFKDYTININSHPLYEPDVFEYNSSLLKQIADQQTKIEDLESFLNYLKGKSSTQNEIEEKLEQEVEVLKQENEKLKTSLLKLSKKKTQKNSEKVLTTTISTPSLPSESIPVSTSQSASSLTIPPNNQKFIINTNKNKNLDSNLIPTESISNSLEKSLQDFKPFNNSQESNQIIDNLTRNISTLTLVRDHSPQNLQDKKYQSQVETNQVAPISQVIKQDTKTQSQIESLNVESNQQDFKMNLPLNINTHNTKLQNYLSSMSNEVIALESDEIDDEIQNNDFFNDEFDEIENKKDDQNEKILKLNSEVRSLKLFFSKERLRIIKFYEEEIKTLKQNIQNKELLLLHKA